MAEIIDHPLEDLMSMMPGPGKNCFEGQTIAYGPIGVYGGHFLGQALAAGFETVDEPKLASSFHAYFLKPGNPSLPLFYHVSPLRNGKRTDMRSITARQDGVDVFHMIASFKLAEEGDEHQKPMPDVPGIQDCARVVKKVARLKCRFPSWKEGGSILKW